MLIYYISHSQMPSFSLPTTVDSLDAMLENKKRREGVVCFIHWECTEIMKVDMIENFQKKKKSSMEEKVILCTRL